MTRRLLTALVVVTLLTTAAVPATVAAAPFGIGDSTSTPEIVTYDGESVPSYIVEYENGSLNSLQNWANSTPSREIEAVTGNNTAVVTGSAQQIVEGGWSIETTDSAPFVSVTTVETPLTKRPYIESVSPNYRLSRTDPVNSLLSSSKYVPQQVGSFAFNDPSFAKNGLAFSRDVNQSAMAGARRALGGANLSSNGTGMTVAVIDTGVNTANGQLFGNGSAGSDIRIANASASFIGSNVTTVNESGYDAVEDLNGHGTWTAAAVAGNPSGTKYDAIASNATVLALKALDAQGSGSTADIAKSVRYAADHDARVVSMSLGSQVWSKPIADAVRYALDNGVKAVVVAAGNSRVTVGSGIATPGDMPGVITVGATNTSSPANAWSAYFSQVGPEPPVGDLGGPAGTMVDVVAPGMQVTTVVATTDGLTERSTLSGTSMATPEVASGIAAAMAVNETLARANHTTVHDAVTASARPVPHAATVEVGHGMFAADNLADGTHPETTQSEAMTSAAEQRDTFYRALSDSRGGLLTKLWSFNTDPLSPET